MVDWTPARLALLVQLDARGMRPAKIAAQFGCTKNTIIGKLDRLNPGKRSARAKGRKKRRARARELVKAKAALAVRDVCTIKDLNEHTCRWPLWDGDTRSGLFCGAWTPGIDERQPYCAVHAKQAFRPPEARSRPYIPGMKFG